MRLEVSISMTSVTIIFCHWYDVVPIILAIRTTVLPITFTIRTKIVPIVLAIRRMVDRTMPGQREIRTGTYNLC